MNTLAHFFVWIAKERGGVLCKVGGYVHSDAIETRVFRRFFDSLISVSYSKMKSMSYRPDRLLELVFSYCREWP